MFLELRHVKKHFPIQKGLFGGSRQYVKAVDDIDLTMKEGENLGIVGESGSGKSTLAKIIMRLYPQDEGTIIFQNEDISHAPAGVMRRLRRDMQMVFQDPFSSLDPRYRIRDVMEEGFTLIHKEYPTRSERLKKIAMLLQSVHLKGDILDRYPHEFSGGERQRIAIARALVLNPKLLILDEAVSSLDVIIQKEILDLLLELQKKFALSYMFITHNLKVVQRLSHRIAVMYKGKIVELATTDEIFNHPLHDYTRDLLAAAVNYQPAYRENPIELDPKSRLVDRGQGHFVMI